jgi:hypothetical protein
MTPGEYDLIPHCHHCYIVTYIALYCRLLSICIGWLGWLNELGIGLSSNSYKPITNTAWVRAWLCKLQKNDALDLQPQVIRFNNGQKNKDIKTNIDVQNNTQKTKDRGKRTP